MNSDTIRSYFLKNKWLFLALIFAGVNLVAIFYLLGFREYGDTQRYINAINWFQGERDIVVESNAFLRPLGPILAVPFEFAGKGAGLIFQNIIFYFLSAVLIFKIVEILFGNVRQAFWAAVFFVTATQVLETGISYLTDMGPWFFYILSIFLAVKFFRDGNSILAPIGGFVAGLGFILKENGGLGCVFYGMMALLSKSLSLKEKILSIGKFGIFFIIPVAIAQGFTYYYVNFTYLDWFLMGGVGTDEEGLALIALRYIGQFFRTLGMLWPLVAIGLWMELKSKNVERLKIYLALLPSSLSFLLWTIDAGGRSVFIFAPLGIMLATVGWMHFESKMQNAKIRNLARGLFLLILLGINYSFALFNQQINFTDKVTQFLKML